MIKADGMLSDISLLHKPGCAAQAPLSLTTPAHLLLLLSSLEPQDWRELGWEQPETTKSWVSQGGPGGCGCGTFHGHGGATTQHKEGDGALGEATPSSHCPLGA